MGAELSVCSERGRRRRHRRMRKEECVRQGSRKEHQEELSPQKHPTDQNEQGGRVVDGAGALGVGGLAQSADGWATERAGMMSPARAVDGDDALGVGGLALKRAGMMSPTRSGLGSDGRRRDWRGGASRPRTAGSKWATEGGTKASKPGTPTPRQATFPGGVSEPRVGVA